MPFTKSHSPLSTISKKLVRVFGSTDISESNIAINQWYHIILKRENGQGSLYIDGNLEGTSDASNCICNSEENLLFGIQWPEPFGGYIRDATFWNYALSENEFNMLSSNLSGYELGLIGYWRFNEGLGLTIFDYSGNQNHGTIHGATWVENIEGCTDPEACNYDETAIEDDGSCEYEYDLSLIHI